MAAITIDRHPRSRPAVAGRPTTRPAAVRWGRLGQPTARAARGPGGAGAAVYRRRRVVAVLVLVAVAFLAGVALTLATASPAGGTLTDEAVDAARVRYVVQPGDSLWQVARAVAPDRDARVVVDAIVEERGTSMLYPGDVVVWPPG